MSDKPEICDRGAAAAYVAELSRDLAVIARDHGLDALGYLPGDGTAGSRERDAADK